MTTQRMLPLYEAKMIHHYDHRWATYEPDGSVRDVTSEEKADPDFAPLPRYWVRENVVSDRLEGRWDAEWLFGWRDICRATDERTTISTVEATGASPEGGTLLCLPRHEPEESAVALVSTFNAFAFDFVARQKVGGTHLKYFTMRQLPVLHPDDLETCPWASGRLLDWLAVRVLELSFTGVGMRAFAGLLGDAGEPFVWDVERRFSIRAELDAAFFHLYGIEREDVDYIMETFPIVKRKDVAAHGTYRTKEAILQVYDLMQEAMASGTAYDTVLDPPPGQGPRHAAKGESDA